MRVVGIAGSPRRFGNTEILLLEALRGAEEEGARTEIFVVGEMNISPCRHCGGCSESGVCVIEDEMRGIYRAIEELDILIIAAPIFFYGLPAQMKAVVDRCQAFWARRYLLGRPIAGGGRRLGAFISVGGTKAKDLFAHAKAVINLLFRILEIEYAGELLLSGIDERGAVRGHPDALRRARALGGELVRRAMRSLSRF